MAEETYSPKVFRPKHTRISELKAEAVKKDRRKKLTQSKFVGGAENTAHPRVIPAPEMRQESEQVSLRGFLPLPWPPSQSDFPCVLLKPLWPKVTSDKGDRFFSRVPLDSTHEPSEDTNDWFPPGSCLSSLLCSQGPCRRHMEASLQEFKASPRMVPRAVYLPNCDRKGFYKRKQVCPCARLHLWGF